MIFAANGSPLFASVAMIRHPCIRAMATSAVSRTKTRASPRHPPAEPSAKVLRRFRAVFNAVRHHFHSVETKVGVSSAEVWALSQVAANPGIGVGQLAQAMDLHQSTVSNLVRSLTQAQLVTSQRGEADRRLVHLHATARGMKVLAKAPQPFTGVLPDALQRLDPATLKRLDRDLGLLIEELRADPRGASVPLWANEN
jgi:DNA-binding MarR family transcriptional regulator